MVDVSKSAWYCVNRDACDFVLGEVVGGELHLGKDSTAMTRGPNLVVTCPNCGTHKVWYTSDPLLRANYQMLDTMATMLSQRVLKNISRETQSF